MDHVQASEKIVKRLERREDEIDLKEAIKALKEIKSGKDKVTSWDSVKKDFGLLFFKW